MRRGGAGAASLIAACVFGAAMLLALVTGVGVYRQVLARTETAAADRLGLSYITAKVHGHDAAGAVRAGSFGGGDALFLQDSSGAAAYETVLYVHDGFLKELFREQGRELGPEAGLPIAAAQRFSVTETEGLLRLSLTDAGGKTQRADIYIRSD